MLKIIHNEMKCDQNIKKSNNYNSSHKIVGMKDTTTYTNSSAAAISVLLHI